MQGLSLALGAFHWRCMGLIGVEGVLWALGWFRGRSVHFAGSGLVFGSWEGVHLHSGHVCAGRVPGGGEE